MIEQLVSRVFQARDVAHRAHWKTKSFSQHMALGDFYDQVIDKIDDIVECYQGEFGLIDDFSVIADAMTGNDIVRYLESEAKWIEDYRSELAEGSTSIENLIDNLLETYNRTLYKLKNLK